MDSQEERTASIGSDFIPDQDELGDLDVGEFGHEVIDDDVDEEDQYDGELSEEDEEYEEEGELVDGEPSDEEYSPDSQSYREMQSMYSKTQNKNSELESQLQQMEDRLAGLGGLDQVVKALTYVHNDPDYRALTLKKSGQQAIPGVDEANLSPEAKEALDLVRKTVNSELQVRLAQMKKEQIDPITDQIRQTGLNDIADDLLENHGELFQSQLPTIERLAKKLPQAVLDNPTYETMESLFYDSLREDGKAEAYYLKQHQIKVNGKKQKVTGSPSGGRAEANTPKFEKPKTMFDAARIASKKAAYQSRRKR
jgi:hypothetical protein